MKIKSINLSRQIRFNLSIFYRKLSIKQIEKNGNVIRKPANRTAIPRKDKKPEDTQNI